MKIYGGRNSDPLISVRVLPPVSAEFRVSPLAFCYIEAAVSISDLSCFGAGPLTLMEVLST